MTCIHITISCRLRPITNKQSTNNSKHLNTYYLHYPFGGHLLSHIIYPWGNLTNIKHLAKGRILCWAQLPLQISRTKTRVCWWVGWRSNQLIFSRKPATISIHVYKYIYIHLSPDAPCSYSRVFSLACFVLVGISMDLPGLQTISPENPFVPRCQGREPAETGPWISANCVKTVPGGRRLPFLFVPSYRIIRYIRYRL